VFCHKQFLVVFFNWYLYLLVSFPWVKRPGRDVDQLPPPRAQVKETIELNSLLPLRAFVVCPRVAFTFTLNLSMGYRLHIRLRISTDIIRRKISPRWEFCFSRKSGNTELTDTFIIYLFFKSFGTETLFLLHFPRIQNSPQGSSPHPHPKPRFFLLSFEVTRTTSSVISSV